MGPGPRARGVDQLSRPGSDGLRGRSPLPCHSRSGPRARGVDQLSRVTLARVRGPSGSTSCPWRFRLGFESAVSTSCPGSLPHGSDIPRCQPALLGDSCSGPRACGVDQLSQVTRPRVRWPTRSINFPGRFGPVSMGPWCRPTVPDVPGQGPKARGVDQHICASRTRVRSPRRRPAVPDNSGPCLRSRGLDQLSWGTWARVRGPAVWTSSCRLLSLGCGGLLGRPALPGDSC